jgi:hypothetical protein
MTRDDESGRSASFERAAAEGGRSADDEEEAPVLDPQYGDLLDAQWLQRGSDALDPDDDLVDIGLTIDMSDSDDSDEAQAMDLDVGTLLTSLPAHESELADLAEPAEREAGTGALHGLLLPEEGGVRRHDDDEEIGDDERFPAFEGLSAPGSATPPDDDAEGPPEG